MSFSFTSLVRLLVLLAMSSTMLAVGLSKWDPPKPARRVRHLPGFSNINEYFLEVADRVPRWLNAETGQIEGYAPEDGDVLEAASCSPWVDEKGQSQVAGRWASRTKDGPMSMSNDFGIARYSFPTGEMLDHISTEIVPVGSPCWFPGTRARILFAAGDGKLYHYAFEPEPWAKEFDPSAKGDTEPQLLNWRCSKPGPSNSFFISDLTWPDDPRMSDCVVVSLREQEPNPEGQPVFSRTKLWWLKLNLAGTEVIEAGQLLDQDESVAETRFSDLRSPTIGALADGKLVLTYLCQASGDNGWNLRIVPVEILGDHQVPKAKESKSLLLSTKCHPTHPILSADGRYLNAISNQNGKGGRVIRFATSSFFKS